VGKWQLRDRRVCLNFANCGGCTIFLTHHCTRTQSVRSVQYMLTMLSGFLNKTV